MPFLRQNNFFRFAPNHLLHFPTKYVCIHSGTPCSLRNTVLRLHKSPAGSRRPGSLQPSEYTFSKHTISSKPTAHIKRKPKQFFNIHEFSIIWLIISMTYHDILRLTTCERHWLFGVCVCAKTRSTFKISYFCCCCCIIWKQE